MTGTRLLLVALVAGWLADRFASTDADVEAGIDAYEAGEHDTALGHYDAAIARLGERPELAFDRGLALLAKGDTEAAKSVFERATEADDLRVRSSAAYELGNLALDAEDFDGAIAQYIECLKARPDHEHAKWNLELALLRKQKKEEEDEKDEGTSDDGGSEESGGEESGGSEGGESGGSEGGESGEPDEKQDDQKQDDQKQDDKQDDQKQDDQKQDDKQDEKKQDDGKSKQDDQKQDESKQDESKQDESKQPEEPAPMDRFDLQRALEQLDEQDQFPLDRARVRTAPAAKDW